MSRAQVQQKLQVHREKYAYNPDIIFIICDCIQLNQHHFVNFERSSTKNNINKRSYSKDNATGEKVPNVIKKRIAPQIIIHLLHKKCNKLNVNMLSFNLIVILTKIQPHILLKHSKTPILKKILNSPCFCQKKVYNTVSDKLNIRRLKVPSGTKANESISTQTLYNPKKL